MNERRVVRMYGSFERERVLIPEGNIKHLGTLYISRALDVTLFLAAQATPPVSP